MKQSIHYPTVIFSIFGSALVALLFLGFNFIEAQWSGAPGTPPSDNIAAPIHTGGGVQSKGNGSQAGNRIGTGIFTAGVEMRSNRYCDVNGNNCFGPGEVGTGGGSGNVNVTDHYLTIRGPETGNKEQVIGRHDFCSISQNMTFDNGGASGGPEEGCRVWQQGGGEWKLRARRNGSASSNTATMCGATCFTLDNQQ
jgi:hypothetical protein